MKENGTPISRLAIEMDILRDKAQSKANLFGKPHHIVRTQAGALAIMSSLELANATENKHDRPTRIEAFPPQCVIEGVTLFGYSTPPVTIDLPPPATATPTPKPTPKEWDDHIPF